MTTGAVLATPVVVRSDCSCFEHRPACMAWLGRTICSDRHYLALRRDIGLALVSPLPVK
jgi:hypothetical protein